MDATMLPGQIRRESEFVGGLTGACGPNALAMAGRWADQSQLSTLDVYRRMRAAGRCDANGASTLAALAADAHDAGYGIAVLDYREPMAAALWRGFLQQHVGREAVVIETANGQALRDALSGLGENAVNLHYHFVLVVGWHPGGLATRVGRDLPPGWWCADGDNRVVGDVLEFYPDDVVAAAQPCAAMAVAARLALPTGGGNSGGGAVTIPTGWRDDGTTLTAPNGHRVVLGLRAYVLAHPGWAPENVPLQEEERRDVVEWHNPGLGVGSRQLFLRTALRWNNAAEGVKEVDLGADLLAAEQHLATLATQVADLQAQVATLMAHTGPADPAGAAALAAIKALAAALGAVNAPTPHP